MQTNTPTSTTDRTTAPITTATAAAAPVQVAGGGGDGGGGGSGGVVVDRSDDSGLHDIRSLAQSTKARLSQRISTQVPVEDDVLSSSSAGWKAVALPEPAKMISLPDIGSLAQLAQGKVSTKAETKAEAKRAKSETGAPVAATAAVVPSAEIASPARPAAVASVTPIKLAAATTSAPRRTMTYVAVGGLAAAALGGFLVLGRGNDSRNDAQPKVAALEPPVAPRAAPAGAAKAEAAPATPVETLAPAAAADVAAPQAPGGAVAVAARDDKPSDKSADHHHKGDGKAVKAGGTTDEQKPADKPEPKGKGDKKPGAKSDGEPSFDDLLKEAGVNGAPKKEAAKLDKKALSGEDMKHGMGAVAGKAQACYQGTSGSVSVKLQVAPSGQVTKVSIGAPFAGTPTGDCVAAAVKGASFPAWDGGPTTVSYSYLLSE